MEVTVRFELTKNDVVAARCLNPLGYVTMAETQGADPCRRTTAT